MPLPILSFLEEVQGLFYLQAGILTYGSSASAPLPGHFGQWSRAAGSPITVAGP